MELLYIFYALIAILFAFAVWSSAEEKKEYGELYAFPCTWSGAKIAWLQNWEHNFHLYYRADPKIFEQTAAWLHQAVQIKLIAPSNSLSVRALGIDDERAYVSIEQTTLPIKWKPSMKSWIVIKCSKTGSETIFLTTEELLERWDKKYIEPFVSTNEMQHLLNAANKIDPQKSWRKRDF
jgi:hypothetical protein